MNGHGQSDRSVVPANPPDKAAAAEAGEERERTKGNTAGETRPGRGAGSGVSSELGRVRQVAQKDKEARFTPVPAVRGDPVLPSLSGSAFSGIRHRLAT